MPTQTQEVVKKGAAARELLETEVSWQKADEPVFPYFTTFGGVKCIIRINDFPEEALYTLIIEDGETFDFDDWPTQWERPD